MQYETNRRCLTTARHSSSRLAGVPGLQLTQSPVRKFSAGTDHWLAFSEHGYVGGSTPGFLLVVNGSQFVSATVIVVNGTAVSTLATSSLQLQATITTSVISAAGTASVTVKTPSGNSSDLGCSSGGTSKALTLTVT